MKILKSSEGFALFIAILVMAIVMLFIGASLLLSRVDTKITSNFKLGTQALEVADAGSQHGLAEIPWLWDFDTQLNCGTPACTLVSNSSFPSGSGFSYTLKASNDLADINNGGSPTNDTNNLIVLTSEANGPSSTKRIVEAYVRRSLDGFTPPSALYINASSAEPQVDSSNSSATGFFDFDNYMRIIGNDTNPNDILDANDDTSGPNPSLLGIATTNDAITNPLVGEYDNSIHDILGVGSEPSIGTVSDILDVDKIAANFFNDPGVVKILNGHITDITLCPSTLPTPRPTRDPCIFGTSSTPQLTYIKDNNLANPTELRGNVTGYGVLVTEGQTTIGGTFKFYGLVVNRRSDSAHYIIIEDNARVYGAVLLGSFDENDGDGEKTRFGVKDNVRLFYSSEALAMVESNWGSLLPKPPEVFAWIDK